MSSFLSPRASAQEAPCQCSFDTLQFMTELRNTQTVVEFGTILDLGYRLYEQGQNIVNCKFCQRSRQSSLITLPVLAEQCLSLLEAACSTYEISRKDPLFDLPAISLEQSLSGFICLKSKITLGQIELEGEEVELLVRMLLNRNLLMLAELLESFKGVLCTLLKDNSDAERVATLRACDSSVDSTIHRLASLIEQLGVESGRGLRHPWFDCFLLRLIRLQSGLSVTLPAR